MPGGAVPSCQSCKCKAPLKICTGAWPASANSLLSRRGGNLWRRSAGDFSLDWLLFDPAHILLERRRDDLARPYIRLAGAHLREAIGVATHQEAGLLRLRASCVLAELLVRNGEAKVILVVAYGSMTEGFGAPDLVKAKALLNSREA